MDQGYSFGKKTSKSNLSKGRELSKSASEKPARVSGKESISTLTVDEPLVSNSVPGTIIDRIDNSSFDEAVAAKLANDELVSPSAKQDGDTPLDPGLPNDSEQIRLEEAATVVQASFRSYQARRAFRTLKCIVRLQAVIRGRLVRRRQAVATLFCVQGIVKFQAIARGYMVRRSNIGNGQCRRQNLALQDAKHCPTGNSLKNAFIYGLFQLLSSSPTTRPLRLQYSPGEPNSAWDWLLRWSISQVWVPYSKQRETCDSELQIVETEQNKPKRNNRKVRSATVGNDSNQAHADTEKLKQKVWKLSSQSVKSGQEPQQSANDKVKHGLKKIQKPTGEISNEAEIDDKKPKRFQGKLSKSPAPKFSEQTSNTPTNKPMENLAEASEQNDVESSLELPGAIALSTWTLKSILSPSVTKAKIFVREIRTSRMSASAVRTINPAGEILYHLKMMIKMWLLRTGQRYRVTWQQLHLPRPRLNCKGPPGLLKIQLIRMVLRGAILCHLPLVEN
ncbi:UNVERIFIED_CONTAM: protein IQ-DOMAIN 31 [Sesamum latifolium]|uniref:Protein IQ-DOMAIN 31 n=1 Tax=Sesamum latifolium TaxID=2727402 RepID=A0AAW2UXJ3_9LAMI